MSAILTVTINPTIDKSASVPAMVADKKLKCSAPILEPGGGGINVARAVSKLGGSATALFLSGGYNGELLKELLTLEGVKVLPVSIRKSTRENLIILDRSSNLQYKLNMPGPEIAMEEWKQLLLELEKSKGLEYIVASGSLSPGVPTDIFAQIAAIAKAKNVKLIVDTSGEALQMAVHEGIYLLKPNLSELAFLAGEEELDLEKVPVVAKQIIKNGKCQVIVVSMGAFGAMLVTADSVQVINAPLVKRKSTVGAGDSMVGGIVSGLSRGYTLRDAVTYGVACGTAATMNPGTSLCNIEDVERLFKSLTTQTGMPKNIIN